MGGPIHYDTPTTDAANYGAFPTSSAAANFSAIQQALNQTGLILLTIPGVYQVSNTLLHPSYTNLYLGKGVTLQLANGVNASTLRNIHAQALIKAANFTFASGTWTVIENGHSRQVGQSVWLEQLAGSTGITAGPVNITAVSGNTWSYAGITATLTGNVSVAPYNPLVGANISIASGFATVTEANHTRQAGNMVYLTGFTAATGTINGSQEIVEIAPGSWMFETTATGSVTGTGNLLGDTSISITGEGIIDGNSANNSLYESTDQFGWIVNHGNVGGLNVSGVTIRSAVQRCWSCFNVSDVISDHLGIGNTQEGIQFEGSAHRVLVRNPHGYSYRDGLPAGANADDFIAFTNTVPGLGGAYDDTVSPSGNGTFSDIEVDTPDWRGGADIIAIAGQMGPYSDFTFRNIRGAQPLPGGTTGAGTVNDAAQLIRITDDGVSLAGTSGRSVTIDGFDTRGITTQGQAIIFGNTGAFGKIAVNNWNWDGSQPNGILLSGNTGATGSINHFEVNNLTVASPTVTYFLTIANNPFTVDKFSMNGTYFQIGDSNSAGIVKLEQASFVCNDLFIEGIVEGSSGLGQIINQTAGVITRLHLKGRATHIGTVLNWNTGNAPAITFVDDFRIENSVGFAYFAPTAPETWTFAGSGFSETGTTNGIFRGGSSDCTFAVNFTNALIGSPSKLLQVIAGTPVLAWTNNDLIQSPAYAASLTIDPNQGQIINVGTLTGNITINAPSNPQVGQRLTLNYTQDATGARTVTYASVFLASTLSAGTAGQKASQNFIYDGTNWIQSGGALTWV